MLHITRTFCSYYYSIYNAVALLGMTSILVEGESFQFILDPRLWLSPLLMIGSRLGVNYSTDEILTFEGQVYLRWNFLRFGKSPEKKSTYLFKAALVCLRRTGEKIRLLAM
jgi:hypothetical protein